MKIKNCVKSKLSVLKLIFSFLVLFLISCTTSWETIYNESDGIPKDRIEEYITYQLERVSEASLNIDGENYTELKYDIDDEGILVQFTDGIIILGFDPNVMEPNGEIVVLLGKELTIEEPGKHKIENVYRSSNIKTNDKNNNFRLFGEVSDSTGTSKMMVDIVINEECVGLGTTEISINGNKATMTGTLGTKSYVQMKNIIQNNPEVNTLVLQEVPGSLNDAVNMHTGRLIRKAGYTVIVPSDGMIASGGVDLFCAGKNRIVLKGAKLGIHSWCCVEDKPANEIPKDHPAHNAQINYFTEVLGEIGKDFYFHTLEMAPSDSIHWMTTDEIRKWKLDTL